MKNLIAKMNLSLLVTGLSFGWGFASPYNTVNCTGNYTTNCYYPHNYCYNHSTNCVNHSNNCVNHSNNCVNHSSNYVNHSKNNGSCQSKSCGKQTQK